MTATLTLPRPRLRPRRRTRLAATEARLFLRSPAALLWGLIIPVAGVIAVGLLPGTRDPQKALGGATFLESYVPVLLVFSLTMTSSSGLPPLLADYRHRGVLKRLGTTPVGPLRVLGVQLGLHLGLAAVAAVLITAIPPLGFGSAAPGQVLALVTTWVLAAGGLMGLGLFLAAVAPSARAAGALGAALFFPLLFAAGLWVPRAQMGGTLRRISDFTPTGAASQSVQDAVAGAWPSALHFGVMAAWAVVFGTLAVRTFRWT